MSGACDCTMFYAEKDSRRKRCGEVTDYLSRIGLGVTDKLAFAEAASLLLRSTTKASQCRHRPPRASRRMAMPRPSSEFPLRSNSFSTGSH